MKAWLTASKRQNQPTCPSTEESINKVWCMRGMECCSVSEQEQLTQATARMDLETIMWRERRVSLVAQLVKNLPAVRETWVPSLGWEDPLEKGEETHGSVLGLPWWLSWSRIHLQCRRPQLSSWFRKISGRRDRVPTPVFLVFPGGSDSIESACGAGDLGSLSGLGRSPRGGHSNPFHYSSLENPHGQWSLEAQSSGSQRVRPTEWLSTAQHMGNKIE